MTASIQPWIAVIGDRTRGSAPQDAIEPAIEHAAASLHVAVPAVWWIETEDLADRGPDLLTGAVAVWAAPGGPYRSMVGALEGIRWARESGVPFLGTCGGFQHGVIEFARNVLGRESAGHAEYGDVDDPDEVFIEELLCSLVGQAMPVRVLDPDLLDAYGTPSPTERYYCRFGLRPAWREQLHEAGLHVAGVDATDGDVRILRLAEHPYFVLTLFVPQTSSTLAQPHPLVTGYLAAANLPRPTQLSR